MAPSQQHDPARSDRPLALVTGASTGIGLELARLFARDGYDLVICAEGADIETAAAELRGLGAQVEAIRADLATEAGVETLAGRFGADRRAPDAACLNAGIGLGGAFVEQELARILKVIDTDVRGTVHLARRILPGMVARGSGRVLFTSSIAAEMPGPFQAVYNAGKAFVQSFSQAVRNELEDSGVTVTALQPGATETNFFHRAELDDTQVGQGAKASAADVARAGYDALMAGKDHVVAGTLKDRVMGNAAKVLPDVLTAQQHRKMTEPGSGDAKA